MDNFGTSERLRRALLLKTGQTTTYITGDDGDQEKGEPHRYYVLSAGQYSGTTNITLNAKTDAHSNACVLDEATGLMWSRAASASVGASSDGALPWTTNGSGEGIYAYATAANAASLAGYTDWRVPNVFSLMTLAAIEAPAAYPDTAAFPTSVNRLWSSTTAPNDTTLAFTIAYISGVLQQPAKTLSFQVRLVRGPV